MAQWNVTIGPVLWGQGTFQYAVMSEPALIVAVSWRAPDVPSSLQAIVGSVAFWIGLLKRNISVSNWVQPKTRTMWTRAVE